MAERLSLLWEKAAPVLVAVLAVTTFGAIWGNVYLARQNLNSQNNHHAATVRADAEIKQLLSDLLQDHKSTNTEIEELTKIEKVAQSAGPALTEGQDELVAALRWIECALSTSPSACGPPPTMP